MTNGTALCRFVWNDRRSFITLGSCTSCRADERRGWQMCQLAQPQVGNGDEVLFDQLVFLISLGTLHDAFGHDEERVGVLAKMHDSGTRRITPSNQQLADAQAEALCALVRDGSLHELLPCQT